MKLDIRIRLPRDFVVNNGEKRMTRNEAIKLLYDIDVRNKPINDNEKNYVLIEKLIALGILKVEEEKPEPTLEEIISALRIDTYSTTAFIEGLKKEGYEIVKKGNNNAE